MSKKFRIKIYCLEFVFLLTVIDSFIICYLLARLGLVYAVVIGIPLMIGIIFYSTRLLRFIFRLEERKGEETE